jgi:hypothetical protein
VQSPEEKTTYVVLGHPAAGRYEVAGEGVRAVGQAGLLPRPKIRARVTGAGARRTLRWTIRNAGGQRVRFVERGDGIAQPLATAKAGRGSTRFRPSSGPGARRTIVAVVVNDGLGTRSRRVARFRVGPARAARPAAVRVARRGGRVRVSWRGGRALTGYDVRLKLRDGRRLLKVTGPGAHRATFRGVGRRARGRVTVVARGFGRDTARPATRRLR